MKNTDYDGLPTWEVRPEMEEYDGGWIGCSVCHWTVSNRVRGFDAYKEWRAHLRDHITRGNP